MYENCLKALGNMDSYIKGEKNKHVLEKKFLVEEIMKYQSQMKS